MSTDETTRRPRRRLRGVGGWAAAITFVVLAALWITVVILEAISNPQNVGITFGVAPDPDVLLIARVGPTGAFEVASYPGRSARQQLFIFRVSIIRSPGIPPPAAPPGRHLRSLVPGVRSLHVSRHFTWHLAPLLLLTGILAYHAAWRPLRRRRRGRRGRCPTCNYDLTGVASAACPECGQAVWGEQGTPF